MHLSVVIPVYGHQLQLETLYNRLHISLSELSNDFEIIMVNDQSPDNAWEVILKLAKNDCRVRGINLSKNFGQHHALTAGLDHARGEWIVMMDCDLQDQPEEIAKLYHEALKGYDIVFGQRKQRQDKWVKRFFSHQFHRVLKFMSGIDHDSSIANFGIYSRNVIDCVLEYREQFRSIGMFLHLVGNPNWTAVPVKHAQRPQGKSSYSFKKRIILAVDAIVANSNRPLKVSIILGFVMSLCSSFYIVWLLILYFVRGIPVAGWPSLMVSLYFLAGIVLINMGFLGLYTSKIYDEVKKRPIYQIRDSTFNEN